MAKIIAALLSHLISTLGVGRHKDSLNVVIYSARTAVIDSA